MRQYFVQRTTVLVTAVAATLIAIILYVGQEKHSAIPPDAAGTATGESWNCTTVGDANCESWQPTEPIEGLALHLEAKMVLEREIYEKGFYQGILRTNVGPIFLKQESQEVQVLSTGQSPYLPAGFGEWGMMDSSKITPSFYDTDGNLNMLAIDIRDGNGISLMKTLPLCFADCISTQVTVPIIKPLPNTR